MTDTLTNTPNTSDPSTSGNDTSPPIGRQVGVRDLRAGDVIAHEIGLAGRVEIARVTAELAPDLTRGGPCASPAAPSSPPTTTAPSN